MTSFKKFTIYKIMYGLISLCKISQFLKAKRSFNITPKEYCFFYTQQSIIKWQRRNIIQAVALHSILTWYLLEIHVKINMSHGPGCTMFFSENVYHLSYPVIYIYIDVHNLHNPGWDSSQVKGFCHIINFLQKEPIFSILC